MKGKLASVDGRVQHRRSAARAPSAPPRRTAPRLGDRDRSARPVPGQACCANSRCRITCPPRRWWWSSRSARPQPRGGAVVHHMPVLAQHQPVAHAPGFSVENGVGVDEIQERAASGPWMSILPRVETSQTPTASRTIPPRGRRTRARSSRPGAGSSSADTTAPPRSSARRAGRGRVRGGETLRREALARAPRPSRRWAPARKGGRKVVVPVSGCRARWHRPAPPAPRRSRILALIGRHALRRVALHVLDRAGKFSCAACFTSLVVTSFWKSSQARPLPGTCQSGDARPGIVLGLGRLGRGGPFPSAASRRARRRRALAAQAAVENPRRPPATISPGTAPGLRARRPRCPRPRPAARPCGRSGAPWGSSRPTPPGSRPRSARVAPASRTVIAGPAPAARACRSTCARDDTGTAATVQRPARLSIRAATAPRRGEIARRAPARRRCCRRPPPPPGATPQRLR
jgi:hypothetical protein